MGFYLQPNQTILRQRKVTLKELRIKKRPDQQKNMFEVNGGFEIPVHVIALIDIEDKVDGDEMALFPINLIAGTEGMWFSSMEQWEKDEDYFKQILAEEMEKLKFVVGEKADNITGFGLPGADIKHERPS